MLEFLSVIPPHHEVEIKSKVPENTKTVKIQISQKRNFSLKKDLFQPFPTNKKVFAPIFTIFLFFGVKLLLQSAPKIEKTSAANAKMTAIIIKARTQ